MSFHTLRVRAHEFTRNRGTFHRSRRKNAETLGKTAEGTRGVGDVAPYNDGRTKMTRFWAFFIFHFSFFICSMPSPSRICVPPLPKGEAYTEGNALVGGDVLDAPKTKMPRAWALFIIHYSFFIPHKYPHIK